MQENESVFGELVGSIGKAVVHRIEAGAGSSAPLPTPSLAVPTVTPVQQRSNGLSKQETLEEMVAIWKENPEAQITDMVEQLDKGRSTLYAYQAELIEAGRVRKNGAGVEVLA